MVPTLEARAATPHRQPALDRVPAPGLVLGAVFSIQFGAALAATLFDDIGPGGTVTLRLLFAAVVLLLLWRPRLSAYTAADLRLAIVFGLVLGAMNAFFYESIDRIPLGVAVTLEFVGPLGVAIVGSRRGLDLVWAGLAAAGIVLLGGGVGGANDALGVAFALIAGACWAAYILLNARLGKRFPGGSGLAIGMSVSALAALPLGIADAGSDLLDPAVLAVGLAVALLSSAIPYSLELEALRRVPAKTFGVLMSLEPAVATLSGLVVLGQSLHALDLLAIALVVAASIGATLEARRPEVPMDA
jgi:inner membrane transporter RhtA